MLGHNAAERRVSERRNLPVPGESATKGRAGERVGRHADDAAHLHVGRTLERCESREMLDREDLGRGHLAAIVPWVTSEIDKRRPSEKIETEMSGLVDRAV